jgi:hybrid cluster-associated redox disulfide protein
MPIMEIITFCPAARGILAEYGLHCVGCVGSAFETLREGCMGHGFGNEDIDDLLTDLNQIYDEMPERTPTITVTESAARAIAEVMKAEGRDGGSLSIIPDGNGGFCLEHGQESDDGHAVFSHPAVPTVRVTASAMALRRIGGAVVDYRDNTFKLDLPEDAIEQCGCNETGGCACKSN